MRLVGRGRELALVEELLARGSHRLVTLWGPSGIGKTQLALQLSARSPPSYFCDLSESHTPDELCRVLAVALNVRLEGQDEAGAILQLGRALAARGRCLLVFDNFEQLVPVAARTLARWTELAPEARLLVTSRELLHLPGEAAFELSALDGAEALELFLLRAREARGDFDPTPDREVIAELVRELEGVPLAIELAAARLRVLSAEQILERMPHRFELLQGSRPNAPVRQSTLRGAIDASWVLLTPCEQEALAQASIFRGGFTLSAAEAVLSLDEPPPMLDLLQSLREKSLLRADDRGRQLRFSLYESIRAFAAERLSAAGRTAELEARHARWFAQRGLAWSEAIDSPGGAERLAELTAEWENLSAALRRSLAVDPPTPESGACALKAAIALAPLHTLRGPLEAFLPLMDRALALPAPVETELLCRARLARALARMSLGPVEAGRRDLEAVRSAAAREELGAIEATALTRLGEIAYAQGRLREAEALHLEALNKFRARGDEAGEALCEGNLANVWHVEGRLDEARTQYLRAVESQRRVGNLRALGRTLARLGFLSQDAGRPAEARAFWSQAMEVHRELENRDYEGIILGYLGNAYRYERQVASARAAYREARRMLRSVGNRRFETTFTMDEAILLLDAGRPGEAADLLREAVARVESIGDVRLGVLCRGYLATAEAQLGNLDASRRLLDAAFGSLAKCQDPLLDRAIALHEGQWLLKAERGGATEARRRLARDDPREGESEHDRFARGFLARALDEAEPPPEALIVGSEASAFRPPGGGWVDLSRRKNLARLLERLALERLEAPGRCLSADALIAAGWPEERIFPSAAANRLRVAVSTLRKLGLGDALQYVSGGYRLDPERAVVRARR